MNQSCGKRRWSHKYFCQISFVKKAASAFEKSVLYFVIGQEPKKKLQLVNFRDTTDTSPLLSCDMKLSFLNIISSESCKSRVIMLSRCIILRAHVRCEPFNCKLPLLSMDMLMVFVELNKTPNSSEKVSQMCKRSWSTQKKAPSTRHHRHTLGQNERYGLCDNQV